MPAFRVGGRSRAVGWVCVSLVVVAITGLVGAFVLTPHGVGPVGPPSRGPNGSGAGAAVTALGDPALLPPEPVASVPVGTEPVAGAVDSANGFVYVANSVSNNISVLNGTSVDATVALPGVGTPDYVVYDALNGYVYVVDRYNFEAPYGAVSVLSGTAVIANLSVGDQPNFALVDPLDGAVYVTNEGGSNVSVLEGTSVVATVPTGSRPCSAAFDPADSSVYVANSGSANVTVLTGTTVVGSVPAGERPLSVVYDPYDQYVYVVNSVSDNATVYSDLNVLGNPNVGADPTFAAFNPTVGGVESANTNSSNVTILNGTMAVGTFPVAAGPVWLGVVATGTFTFVIGEDANAVTVLNGTTVVATEPVGSVPVFGVPDPGNGLDYVINSGSNNVTVLGPAFPVTFTETGLAPATAWAVTLAGRTNTSTGPSIGFLEPAGSYAYTIGTPAGYELVSSVPPSPVSVIDQAVGVAVTFAPVPTVPYNLTFNETGLTKNCSSRGGGMGGDGGGGRCCMSNTSATLSWSVTVDSVTRTTNGTSITFSETNGTYAYTITPPSGWEVTASVPPSPVTIDGAGVTVQVTFARTTVPVQLSIMFRESGLPWGTTWCVTLNVTECSSGRAIVFSDLAPGAYSFNVSPVPGYTAQPSSGTVTLTHRDVVVCVRFMPTTRHPCM